MCAPFKCTLGPPSPSGISLQSVIYIEYQITLCIYLHLYVYISCSYTHHLYVILRTYMHTNLPKLRDIHSAVLLYTLHLLHTPHQCNSICIFRRGVISLRFVPQPLCVMSVYSNPCNFYFQNYTCAYTYNTHF